MTALCENAMKIRGSGKYGCLNTKQCELKRDYTEPHKHFVWCKNPMLEDKIVEKKK